MIRLGVNIDHVATLREARKTNEPDPVTAAGICELAGADGITVHLREDRRHIQDRDVHLLRQTVRTKLNLEMANSQEIIRIALDLCPDQVCMVPERREEVTTEGGLDVASQEESIAAFIEEAKAQEIHVSLFVDPEPEQILASARTGAASVELHTGAYANARGGNREAELARLLEAAALGAGEGLAIHAGHGIDYWNITPLLGIPHLQEMNIGHSIISRAVLMGLDRAVREMKALINL